MKSSNQKKSYRSISARIEIKENISGGTPKLYKRAGCILIGGVTHPLYHPLALQAHGLKDITLKDVGIHSHWIVTVS